MSEARRIGRIQLKRVLRPPAAFQAAGGVRAQGQVLDLSADGLFFATPLLAAPGTRGSVVFEYPRGTGIEVRGEVCWNTVNLPNRTPGFGMKLEHPPDSYRDLYQKILAKLKRPR